MTETTAATLPAQTSFLGREAELAEAGALLRETRLLSIVGPGGVGKTRFALELARRAGDAHQDGVYACFLASLRDSSLVLSTIARTLSLREQPGLSALETLVAYLEGRELLLLVDNLEHLLPSTTEISELRASCPGLTLLVTSRERLHVDEELAYDLPSLAEDEGIALFCERAQVEPNAAIGELCLELEGLPLAIELAAARLSVLSPEQLLDRLGVRLDLLKRVGDGDPRQLTLRATVQWSYDLLAAREQDLFSRLGVFTGGCTFEAAEAVAGGDREALGSLVDKSMLRERGSRYHMLETIREFAFELLENADATQDARASHARHYTELALASDVGLEYGDADVWAEVEADADNLRAALEYCLEHEQLRALDAARALDRFWQRGSRDREGYALLQRALSSASGAPPLDRGRALVAAASLAIRMGALDDAAELLDAATIELRRADSPPRIAAALNNRGLVALLQRDYSVARRCLEESLAIKRSLGDELRIAPALSNLGKLAAFEGDLDRAEQLLEEALEMRQRTSSPWSHQTLFDLSIVHVLRGDPVHARKLSAEALLHAEGDGDPTGTIEAGALLAICCVLSDDVAGAREALCAACEHCAAGGYEGKLPFVLWSAAGYATAVGKSRDGLLLLGAGMDAGPAECGEHFERMWHDRVLVQAGDPRSDELIEQGRIAGLRASLARAEALLAEPG